MKTTLIYGEDEFNSRQRFIHIIKTIKNRGWEIVYVGKEKLENLSDVVLTNSLFASDTLFAIENFNKIPISELNKIFSNKNIASKILFYQKGEINKSLIKKFIKDINLEVFDFPKTIFNFLEKIYPGNSKEILNLLKLEEKNQKIEIIFSLIAKSARDLYWSKINSKSIPYPLWRLTKIKKTEAKWEEKKLINWIKNLLKIDLLVKKGKADYQSELDLLIVKELQ